MFSDGRITGHKGEIPDELRRAWSDNETLRTENEGLKGKLAQEQNENAKLKEKNTELQRRLGLMTQNYRVAELLLDRADELVKSQ